jgi:hypothetical protein
VRVRVRECIWDRVRVRVRRDRIMLGVMFRVRSDG